MKIHLFAAAALAATVTLTACPKTSTLTGPKPTIDPAVVTKITAAGTFVVRLGCPAIPAAEQPAAKTVLAALVNTPSATLLDVLNGKAKTGGLENNAALAATIWSGLNSGLSLLSSLVPQADPGLWIEYEQAIAPPIVQACAASLGVTPTS